MPLIRLFFVKLFFGRFSYRYKVAFASNKNKIRSRRNYQRACSRTDPLSHYFKATKSPEKITVFQCNDNLVFGEVLFGKRFSEVKRSKGTFQCYDIVAYDGHFWKRLGYKERILNAGVKRIYHFLGDEFFFGELSFSDAKYIDDKKIASVLIQKYTGKKLPAPDGDYRIDHNDGFIYVENSGINLSIKYIFTSNPAVNAMLEKILSAGKVLPADEQPETTASL